MAEVVIVDSADAAGEVAADLIQKLVVAKPEAVLGLATGSTPLSTWRALAARRLDLSRVRGFALDEYVGLPAGHPESYASVIARDSDHFLAYFSPALARYRADPDVHARRLARLVIQLARGALQRSRQIRIMPEFCRGESLGEIRDRGRA